MDFLALGPDHVPHKLDASEGLGGLKPDNVCDAVEGMRFALTGEELRKAVTRIVHQRQRASVREAEAAYTS